jgi:cytochrome c
LRIALIFGLFLCLIACHTTKQAMTSAPIVINASDSVQGLKLMEGDNCFTCHRKDDLLIGPSFMSIANKYHSTLDDLEKLSIKILAGGSGVWGEIPMVPHPYLNKADSEKMVKYILSLKNKTP